MAVESFKFLICVYTSTTVLREHSKYNIVFSLIISAAFFFFSFSFWTTIKTDTQQQQTFPDERDITFQAIVPLEIHSTKPYGTIHWYYKLKERMRRYWDCSNTHGSMA